MARCAEPTQADYPPDLDVYRIQDQWRCRRGVVVRAPSRWWRRTWQAEWTECQRAVRGYSRTGCLVKAVRRWRRSAEVA